MCVVSAIIDYGQKRWPGQPWSEPWPTTYPTTPALNPPPPPITREEFDELKRLVEAGRVFDEKTKQAECEAADKLLWLQRTEEDLNAQSVASDVRSGQPLGPSERQINERLYADFMEAGMQLEAMGMLFNASDTMALAERLFNYAKVIREELLDGEAP